MTITEERKAWLRGAYLDRITETAMHYAASHTHFVDAEWESCIVGAFEYLTELTAEEHGYLREQAGYEAWTRIRAALFEASKTAFAKLRHDNGDVIDADANFALGMGWLSLLQHAADRVRSYPDEWNAKIVGGKEKLGCLVLHIACDFDARGCRSEVERLREEIRLRSLSTCEICGEAGRLRLSSYAKTVCDTHVSILGDLREDDGQLSDPYKWHEEQPLEHHIDDVVSFGRALMSDVQHQKRQSGDEYSPEAAEVLKDLVPVRPRPKDHVVNLVPQTAISRQIERDIEKNHGRKTDLLLEFCGVIELAVVAAMSVTDDDVDFWLRSEVDKWQGAQPLSEDDDRAWLHRYLRSLVIDERGRQQRREDGADALKRFFADNPTPALDAGQLVGRERELLDAYAGDLADSARGSVVKEEFLEGYIRDEIALWPAVLELSDDDREWLRQWLRKMIDAEYERIKNRL
jgi:hypothetical protein